MRTRDIGTVADMLIDPRLRVPRLLVLEIGGGLLGMGKKQYLVPLEATTTMAPGPDQLLEGQDHPRAGVPAGRWRGGGAAVRAGLYRLRHSPVLGGGGSVPQHHHGRAEAR